MKQSKILFVFHWALISYSNNISRWITQGPGFFMSLLQSHCSHHPTAGIRKSRVFPYHWELFLTHTFKHHHLPSFLIFNRITPFFTAVVHGWLEEQVKRTPPCPCNGSACGSAAEHLHLQLHFHKHRQYSPKSLTSTPHCDSASSTFNIYTI